MDPNTLAIAVVVGIVMWVMMRRRRQSGNARGTTAAARRPEEKPRTMPRVGTPGSITFNQIQALKQNNFTPDKSWSREEAALILDAVAYLRAVCRAVAGDEDGLPPLEVQNELLRTVLTTEDVREYVRKWGEERRAAGIDEFADDEPELPRNNQFEHVAKAARKFLSSPAASSGAEARH